MSFKETMGTTFGCLFMLVFVFYGLVQLYAGYVGIGDRWGDGWAIAAGIAAFAIRFTLPLTIGAFFAARDVWGWHWGFALLFAAPGLLFMALMIPSVIADIAAKFRK